MSIRCVNPWSWYPLVASADLGAGAVMPALLLGERLVVWRAQGGDGPGRVGVWNDRCPHRGMRLSLGAALDATLICPYHGWEFASDGSCSRIPAHPGLSPSRAARARLYPVMETDGYVWACIGEPAAARPQYQPIGPVQPVRTMHLRCDAETAALALLRHPLDGAPAVEAAWSIEAGDLAVSFGGVVSARLELPGRISAAGYVAHVQPTGDATAAVHVALRDPAAEPDAPLALNAALVRFRQDLPALAEGGALDAGRQGLAALADLQQDGD